MDPHTGPPPGLSRPKTSPPPLIPTFPTLLSPLTHVWPPRFRREPQLLLGPRHLLLASSLLPFRLFLLPPRCLMGSCLPTRLRNPRAAYITMAKSQILAPAYQPRLCLTLGIVPIRASALTLQSRVPHAASLSFAARVALCVSHLAPPLFLPLCP